jgi:hypothetical protein
MVKVTQVDAKGPHAAKYLKYFVTSTCSTTIRRAALTAIRAKAMKPAHPGSAETAPGRGREAN